MKNRKVKVKAKVKRETGIFLSTLTSTSASFKVV